MSDNTLNSALRRLGYENHVIVELIGENVVMTTRTNLGWVTARSANAYSERYLGLFRHIK
jgi:hypothetical protein